MKYELFEQKDKNGKSFYMIYVIEKEQKVFLTSFFPSRYNRKAIKLLRECSVCK